MSGNCELGRGLRRRKKNATEEGAGRFEKPAPDARAASSEAHESLISRKTGAEVPLTGLSFLTVFRLGARQRWQTKRGPMGNRRIIDWIVFDVDGELFPTTSQNFGQTRGLWQYDFRWHVGDHTTLLSTADVDFFTGGQQLYTFGALLNRTPRGSFSIGFNEFGGPIDVSVLTGSYTYRMSPKWASSFGAALNLKGMNIGQNFQLVRIGESFLMTFGFNVDYSRNNVGFTFNLEPRFLSRTQFASRTGLGIPMPGAYGLE